MKEVNSIKSYHFFSARFKYFISIAYDILLFNTCKRSEINKNLSELESIIINAEI